MELNLGTIERLLDGNVFRIVQKLIGQAVEDCESRLGDKRPRKVVLTLELRPRTRMDERDGGDTLVRVLDGISLKFKPNIVFPCRETIEIDCGVGDDHTLLFNPDNPHNHRQTPLPMTFDGEARNTVPISA